MPGAADAEAITISKDHVHMAKFASREDSGYEKISGHLHLMTQDASNTIKWRWEQESRIEKGMKYSRTTNQGIQNNEVLFPQLNQLLTMNS